MPTKLFDSNHVGTGEQAPDSSRNVLESSDEHSIIDKALDGRIPLWNEGARRLCGHEPEDVVGKATSDIPHTPEDVRPGIWEGERACERQGTLLTEDLRHFTRSLTPNGDT
ncbi:MAG: PAS domain-containing protein [Limisphaerales bacterium]